MSKRQSLDDKILSYLSLLNNKQKRAVMKLVKELGEKKEYDIWEDPEFMAELDRRTADLESGKDRGYSWEEV